jgi:ribonuclease P protein component
MTRRVEFDAVVRRGRRAGRTRLVAHAHTAAPLQPGEPTATPFARPHAAVVTPRVGFVVSRAVGGSVVRNRVVRRLRHLVRPRLAQLPPGTLLVLRALPAAATATSAELATDLDALLRRLRLVDARPADAPLVDAP